MEQTKEFMIDLLRKVQEMQVVIASLNLGYSMHVDLASSPYYKKGFCLYFNVAVFRGTELLGSWEFHYLDDANTLQVSLDELTNYVNQLQKCSL